MCTLNKFQCKCEKIDDDDDNNNNNNNNNKSYPNTPMKAEVHPSNI
jgi:hypothetical protein